MTKWQWQACNLISICILPHGHTSCHTLTFLLLPFQSQIHNCMQRLKLIWLNKTSFLPIVVDSCSSPFYQPKMIQNCFLHLLIVSIKTVYHLAHFQCYMPLTLPWMLYPPLQSEPSVSWLKMKTLNIHWNSPFLTLSR